MIADLHKEYSKYILAANMTAANLTSDFNNRYSHQEQENVITDFFHLASADFVVCTFTSNLMRLAYKLRTALKPLVTDLYEVVSLDTDFYEDYRRFYHVRHVKIAKHASQITMLKKQVVQQYPPTEKDHLTSYRKNMFTKVRAASDAPRAKYSRAAFRRILHSRSYFPLFEKTQKSANS